MVNFTWYLLLFLLPLFRIMYAYYREKFHVNHFCELRVKLFAWLDLTLSSYAMLRHSVGFYTTSYQWILCWLQTWSTINGNKPRREPWKWKACWWKRRKSLQRPKSRCEYFLRPRRGSHFVPLFLLFVNARSNALFPIRFPYSASSCQGTPNPLLDRPSPLPVPPKKEVLIKNAGQGSNGMIMLVDVKIYFSWTSLLVSA